MLILVVGPQKVLSHSKRKSRYLGTSNSVKISGESRLKKKDINRGKQDLQKGH